jgi:glutamate--cysteine ligase
MTNNISILDTIFKKSEKRILDWIEHHYNGVTRPIFTSIDIRNAGFKIAHVDTNLFPAGFNNVSKESQNLAKEYLNNFLRRNFPHTKNILLIPENFTRNVRYLENLKVLSNLFTESGYNSRIGSTEKIEGTEIQELGLHISQVQKQNNKIHLDEFFPDLVILNNDLTQGVPEVLTSIEQPVIPNLNYGWHNRRKNDHFQSYNKLAEQFSKEFNFDPWLICTEINHCNEVDFRNKKGLECVAAKVDTLLSNIKDKYKEFKISSPPFVFIKSDMGTYGLGIMRVNNGEEILNINKKHRHTMQAIKHGVQNSEVLIQEGVPTIEKYNNHPSETMAYLIDGKVFDFVERVNADKDDTSNLNSHGMYFESHKKIEFNAKTVISLLATLATTKENLGN